jgi:hypothetical protein
VASGSGRDPRTRSAFFRNRCTVRTGDAGACSGPFVQTSSVQVEAPGGGGGGGIGEERRGEERRGQRRGEEGMTERRRRAVGEA